MHGIDHRAVIPDRRYRSIPNASFLVHMAASSASPRTKVCPRYPLWLELIIQAVDPYIRVERISLAFLLCVIYSIGAYRWPLCQTHLSSRCGVRRMFRCRLSPAKQPSTQGDRQGYICGAQ